MNAIFLLGSERSGSNLLRTLLGNHSAVAAPIPVNLCDVFYPYFQHYHPLDDTKRQEILTDIEQYINHPFNNWDITLNKERMVSNYTLNTFIDFLHATYTEKAIISGKSCYFSKDNHNHKYALGMLKDIPNAKFVYLCRDPRDQVASWMKTPFHLHTPYRAVMKWTEEQLACLNLDYFHGVKMHFIRYENLVDDPKKEMSSLLQFLGLPIEEKCFNTQKENKDTDINPLWSNINKPIKKQNYGKYKEVLSKNDLLIVESIARKQMLNLGYTPETTADWKMKRPTIFKIRDKIRSKLSERKHRSFIENDMKLLNDRKNFTTTLFSKFHQ